jgi:hypothetical protein
MDFGSAPYPLEDGSADATHILESEEQPHVKEVNADRPLLRGRAFLTRTAPPVGHACNPDPRCQKSARCAAACRCRRWTCGDFNPTNIIRTCQGFSFHLLATDARCGPRQGYSVRTTRRVSRSPAKSLQVAFSAIFLCQSSVAMSGSAAALITATASELLAERRFTLAINVVRYSLTIGDPSDTPSLYTTVASMHIVPPKCTEQLKPFFSSVS